MLSRRYRARIALAFAMFLSTSLMPAVAGAGEFHDRPAVTAANQQQALLFLLTMLTVAKTTVAHADQFISGYSVSGHSSQLLYADAQDSKDWVHGAD
jgi:hypothetical protein